MEELKDPLENLDEEFNPIPGQGRPVKRKKFWKLFLLMSLIFAGFVIVIGRLFYIQVLNSGYYSEKARRQHESNVTLKAERGNIYDRNGRLLATDINSISLAVDPQLLNRLESSGKPAFKGLKTKLSKILAVITGEEESKLLRKLNNTTRSFIWLRRGLNPGMVSRIDSLRDKGLIIIEEPNRYYLYGNAGAQVIGCTDIDNRGINGIEKYLDTMLRGKSGYMFMHRDALGFLRPSASLPLIPAEHGNSVKLTIDIELQKIVEFEIAEGVRNFSAESGTAIVIDPSTGELLAMASYPGYDPNKPEDSPAGSMRIRGVTDTYEPGSTFKLVTAAAALEEGLVDTADVFNGFNGLMTFDEFKIKDDHPQSSFTFREALEKSSNIVFSQIAAKLPMDAYFKYIRDFGFGMIHDIDLPGESAGIIPSPGGFDITKRRFAGFGYGISVTPLQLAVAYASVANKGIMYKPYCIYEIYNPEGERIRLNKPEKIRRVISSKTASLISQLLKNVVNRGTGVNARINNLDISGKTGTAQQLTDGSYTKSHYNASFVGYYPTDNPEMVILVLLDRPKGIYYGGSTAAPIFRNIVARWIMTGK
jgi:cell division protein FtsI/penicillin-binding protein 2